MAAANSGSVGRGKTFVPTVRSCELATNSGSVGRGKPFQDAKIPKPPIH